MSAYTADALPEAEALVARDLEVVIDAVRGAAAGDALRAIVLLGGYARGEGAVIRGDDGSLHAFNDYDFVLLFDETPGDPGRYAALAVDLAARLGIDFVDFGLVTPAQLAGARPTLFWYELGEAHRVLWRADERPVLLPRFAADALERAEGTRLLENRGMALLWAALRLWPEGRPGEGPVTGDRAALAFTTIAAHKAISAAGDAALLRAGTYVTGQAERIRRLRAAGAPDWAGEGFLDACGRAAAFRRHPEIPPPEAVAVLWHDARDHHERGLRAAETWRLGVELRSWDAHRRRVGAELVGRRLRAPRLLARSARDLLAGGPPLEVEEIVRLRLPRILHESTTIPAGRWRARARALVTRWHP